MSVIKKFSSVGGATMASRVLGFVREAMIGAALGAGPVADVFYAAFGFPNLFRRIFAEGAFNSAFVPLFTKRVDEKDLSAARQFAEEVMAVLIITVLGLTAIALIAMPFLVSTAVAPYFVENPAKFELTVLMTRIMFPYLFCMALVAMISGMMNSLSHYFLAAIVPTLLNVLLILALAIAMAFDFNERTTGLCLAWGVYISGFVQLLLLIYGLKKLNLSLRLRMPKLTPDVKRTLALMGPAILTGGVLQINLLIGRVIASAQDGAFALLNYADRINQLPLGVIGIAIGVVLLPELSRALRDKDSAEANSLQNRSMEFALAFTLPAAIGFIIFPDPIISLLYERGAFDSSTTTNVALALAAFGMGLPAYVLIKVFQPAYFAHEDMRTPFYFSIIMVITNVGLSLLFFPTYGHVGIALATAISAWVNFLLLAAGLMKKRYFIPAKQTIKRVILMLIAALIMGAALFYAQELLFDWLYADLFIIRALTTLITISAAAVLYFLICFLTNAIDRGEIKHLIKRR
jgi:putative peptidoglycan lipid II flippase